jgi:hypothetical protein
MWEACDACMVTSGILTIMYINEQFFLLSNKSRLNGPAKQPDTLGKWMKSNQIELSFVALVNPLDFSKLVTPPNYPLRLSLGS